MERIKVILKKNPRIQTMINKVDLNKYIEKGWIEHLDYVIDKEIQSKRILNELNVSENQIKDIIKDHNVEYDRAASEIVEDLKIIRNMPNPDIITSESDDIYGDLI